MSEGEVGGFTQRRRVRRGNARSLTRWRGGARRVECLTQTCLTAGRGAWRAEGAGKCKVSHRDAEATEAVFICAICVICG